MTRPAGEPIGPNDDIALGQGVSDTIEKHVRVLDLRSTARAKRLLQCQAFYDGTHHDHLKLRWDGSYRDPGVGYMHERLKPQGFVPVQSAPYGNRKPDTGLPLVRQIVNRFSEMLLGAGRRPSIYVAADIATERYLQAVFNESMSWDVLMEARDVAGTCGAAAIVPAVIDGVPTAEVLAPYDVYVTKWKNAATWQPLEVMEQRLVDRTTVDEESGELVVKKYWRTRLWTETHTIQYDDVPKDWDPKEPLPFSPENKVEHKAGRCPVVWYQNTRNAKAPEGKPDCDGVYHLIDQLDRIMSQTYKAARANVDPMLHLKEEERLRRKINRVDKGGLVSTSAAGDIKYVEMEGTSVTTAMDVINCLRQECLQTAECVIVDPSTAGAYKTGEALQLLWRAMEAKANRLRVMLQQAMKELARIWLALGTNLKVANLEDATPGEGILLPPVVEPVEMDDDLLEEGERPPPKVSTQVVGTGYHVEFRWPPYWNPTAKQVAEMAQAMATAKNAGVLSAETRVTEMANMLGLDAQEEVARVQRDSVAAAHKAEEDFEREMERLQSEEVDKKVAGQAETKTPAKPGSKDEKGTDKGTGDSAQGEAAGDEG